MPLLFRPIILEVVLVGFSGIIILRTLKFRFLSRNLSNLSSMDAGGPPWVVFGVDISVRNFLFWPIFWFIPLLTVNGIENFIKLDPLNQC